MKSTAEEFYEGWRKRGLTDEITEDPDPDYSLDFYINIFQLMDAYAEIVIKKRMPTDEEERMERMKIIQYPLHMGPALMAMADFFRNCMKEESEKVICKDCKGEISIEESVFYWNTGARRCIPCSESYNRINDLKEESKPTKDDSHKCCICHENYVDSDNGFDTCQDCLNRI